MSWQSKTTGRPGRRPRERAGEGAPGAPDREARERDPDPTGRARPGADAERSPAAGGGSLCSISEVQRETGLSARTLRYYEELGLLPGVRRRAAGRRVYGADEVERVRFIQRLKKLGLSLSEIKELNAVYGLAGSTHAMLVRLAELLDRHRRDVEERIAELSLLRGEIDRYRRRVEQRIRGQQRAGEETA